MGTKETALVGGLGGTLDEKFGKKKILFKYIYINRDSNPGQIDDFH